MATAAQARLETALQRLLDLDCKLRRTGARVTQDKAILDALKAADNELQAASLAAPDTLLPPRLLSALQRALVESCGRGGDSHARMLRCFAAAATLRALLQGFTDIRACTNQAGCRRQQVRGIRRALHLGCVWHSGGKTQHINSTLGELPRPSTGMATAPTTLSPHPAPTPAPTPAPLPQIGRTPGMLQALSECLHCWRGNSYIVEPVLVDLNRLMTC
jgi:hypothetical protein